MMTDLTNLLVGVLIRFRVGPVAFMVDIKTKCQKNRISPKILMV